MLVEVGYFIAELLQVVLQLSILGPESGYLLIDDFLLLSFFVQKVPNLLAVGVLNVGDGVLMLVEHFLGPATLENLIPHGLVLPPKLPDDIDQSLNGRDQLLESVGQPHFLLADVA